MTPVSTDSLIYDFATAVKVMAELIREALSAGAVRPNTGRSVIRLQVPVEPIDLLSWQREQVTFPQVYWSGRDAKFETTAIGKADSKNRVADIIPYLSEDNHELRYYGGCRFDTTTAPDKNWSVFGTAKYILPRFELVRHGSQTSFACNLLPDRDTKNVASILAQLDRLSLTVAPDKPFVPTLLNRNDLPDQQGWKTSINSALEMIQKGQFEKIVLARKSTFEFAEKLSPSALMQKIKEHTPGCYHFCIQPVDGIAFIGASPEQLYVRDNNHIKSEALAGTRRRGKNDYADSQLGDELLSSDKDIREHRYVTEGIRESFQRLCRKFSGGEQVALMKLARVQHLVSHFEGRLSPGITDADILDILPPTPAVCGRPTGIAQKQIERAEPFDRGWYTGPVGCIGHNDAEFAVAIRSGLITGSTLRLYSGAGIVEGSDPVREWDEIESKIRNYLRILT